MLYLLVHTASHISNNTYENKNKTFTPILSIMLTPLARLTPRSLTPTLPLVARALKRCRFAPISARSFWSHAGTLARLFATLALAPSMDQSTINIIENAYEKKCLRHPRLRLDVACRSLCSRLLAHSLCSYVRPHVLDGHA